MKKLGKKYSEEVETIEAYCSCTSCRMVCRCIPYSNSADATAFPDQMYYENNYSSQIA